MTRLLTNDSIRKRYLQTTFDNEVLLDLLRFRGSITEYERQACWVLLSDLCYSRAKSHYKQTQATGTYTPNRCRNWFEMPNPKDFYGNRGYTKHTDRMMLLLEFLDSRLDKSVGWCIVSWKRRFAQFEELLYLRGLGIHIPVERVQCKEVRGSILFGRLIRSSGVSFEPVYNRVLRAWTEEQELMGNTITPRRLSGFVKRWQAYDMMMRVTKYSKSFEALHESNQV